MCLFIYLAVCKLCALCKQPYSTFKVRNDKITQPTYSVLHQQCVIHVTDYVIYIIMTFEV